MCAIIQAADNRFLRLSKADDEEVLYFRKVSVCWNGRML
jgi:hypothetical protein